MISHRLSFIRFRMDSAMSPSVPFDVTIENYLTIAPLHKKAIYVKVTRYAVTCHLLVSHSAAFDDFNVLSHQRIETIIH